MLVSMLLIMVWMVGIHRLVCCGLWLIILMCWFSSFSRLFVSVSGIRVCVGVLSFRIGF